MQCFLVLKNSLSFPFLDFVYVVDKYVMAMFSTVSSLPPSMLENDEQRFKLDIGIGSGWLDSSVILLLYPSRSNPVHVLTPDTHIPLRGSVLRVQPTSLYLCFYSEYLRTILKPKWLRNLWTFFLLLLIFFQNKVSSENV